MQSCYHFPPSLRPKATSIGRTPDQASLLELMQSLSTLSTRIDPSSYTVNAYAEPSTLVIREGIDLLKVYLKMIFREDIGRTKVESKEENEDHNVSTEIEKETETETENKDKDLVLVEIEPGTRDKHAILSEQENRTKRKELCKAIMQGLWPVVEATLSEGEDSERETLNSDKNTVLHLAVGIGHNNFIKNLLRFIEKKEEHEKKRNLDRSSVLEMRNLNGSTALHVAAIVGNRFAAELLVNKNKNLLTILDNDHQPPLFKAYSNMQFDTFIYLWNAANDDGKSKQAISQDPDRIKIGVNLVVNAISAKQYSTASELVKTFPQFVTENDDVLMAIARTFPNGLNYWETLFYPPSLSDIWDRILYYGQPVLGRVGMEIIIPTCHDNGSLFFLMILLCVPPIKNIVEKKKEWEEAKTLLELVCNKIDASVFSGPCHPNYNRPILEAACQNAYQVVDEILYRSPETIQSTDENGLAPSHELNRRTGAALQLQRELQWREELKKFVFPAYITQENIFKETPSMVFTREHQNLVKEGEKWMKTTAESCSITAALITTIVFAAAITVPGGNNQETGIPLFRTNIAFIIFAASDAISLFTSTTALLVFLSILTARFAEQDFLISLPRRLIIGFCALLLSTTAMIVAFGAVVYIVFCDQEPWMLGLICGLAFIPIAFFVTLQFSLIVDLYRSTYGHIFGKRIYCNRFRFNPSDVQGFLSEMSNHVEAMFKNGEMKEKTKHIILKPKSKNDQTERTSEENVKSVTHAIVSAIVTNVTIAQHVPRATLHFGSSGDCASDCDTCYYRLALSHSGSDTIKSCLTLGARVISGLLEARRLSEPFLGILELIEGFHQDWKVESSFWSKDW
ncbi:hypothetical protein OSB04_un000066 [Centaurea solstitialis]|uniref:PGG domain-containing protein n=1 Tax=Centaurea solstitialis TaxID=347529 RepID=A0AA38VVV1_9ASTR|nr:hypothetical protein OSB04_un000066 [Centaurea solstitialis]